MYYKRVWKCGKTIEIYKSYSRPTERKKSGKRKISEEQILKNNRQRAVATLTRKLNANFNKNDAHVVLTYTDTPSVEEARKRVKNFLRCISRKYKRIFKELKYVLVTEYLNKRIHHHLVINGFGNLGELISDNWQYGLPKITMLDKSGQYRKLAEYLIKETDKTHRQADGSQKQRYTCSRNLIIPPSKIKSINARAWREEPKIPDGYYLDSETLYNGVDPFTQKKIQKYTLIELDDKREKNYMCEFPAETALPVCKVSPRGKKNGRVQQGNENYGQKKNTENNNNVKR